MLLLIGLRAESILKNRRFLSIIGSGNCRVKLVSRYVTPQNWVERDPTLKDIAKMLKSKEGTSSQISFGMMGLSCAYEC